MAIPLIQWPDINQYMRESVLSLFGPHIVPAKIEANEAFKVSHHGIYLGVVNRSGNPVARLGFMDNVYDDILPNLTKLRDELIDFVKTNNWTAHDFVTSSLHYCIVMSVVFMENPLTWNEQADGIYFQWGESYRGFYLPYEIQRMSITKTEIMNHLCSLEAHVPSNLWRLPEGLCFKLICDSYSAFN